MKKNLSQIFEPLDNYLAQVDVIIRRNLNTGIDIIDDALMHIFAGGGKKVRASLVILTNCLQGKISEEVLEIAAAVEIIHSATLIHDDIIDQSLYRRGKISMPQKWGNKISVLGGDYLYTAALDIVVKNNNVKLFPVMVDGTKKMVEGELYQILYSNIDSVTEEHYYKTIELKTARYMATCAKLGAIISSMNDVDCERIYDFGLNLGYAFQIIDDLLDIVGKETVGKDLTNDINNGKVTLPLLFLYNNSNSMEKSKIVEILNDPELIGWDELKENMIESGAIKNSTLIAEEYVMKAKKLLDYFPESNYKKILYDLSDFLIYRDF